MREEIEKIPDGVYRAEGVVEQMEGKGDVVIKAAVEVRGSDITVDLDGSSPQVDWGGNVVFNFTYAYVFMAMKSMFGPDIPNNDGCARPIRLAGPRGDRGQLPLPCSRCRADGDRPLSHRNHLQGPIRGPAAQGDCGERRHPGGDECLLWEETRREAVAFGRHQGRGHGGRSGQ